MGQEIHEQEPEQEANRPGNKLHFGQNAGVCDKTSTSVCTVGPLLVCVQ